MLSKSFLIAGSFLATLLLRGCGSAPYAAGLSQELPMPNDVAGKIYYVEGERSMAFSFWWL